MKKEITCHLNGYLKPLVIAFLSVFLVLSFIHPAQSDFFDSSWDFFTGATRNKEARKNIITVLKELRIIDDYGRINGSSSAAKYYFNLLKNSKGSANKGLLSLIPESERHSGQFWANVVAGKMIGRSGGFNYFDPRNAMYFEMQKVLMQDTKLVNGKSFADVAYEKGFRHIDILDKAVQRGVGVGAGVILVSIAKVAGIDLDIDSILEKQEQLEMMENMAADPSKACAILERYIKNYIEKEIYNKLETKLKRSLGEPKYIALKRKYNKLEGARQQYMALLNDLYQISKEPILKRAYDKLNRLPAIIENLQLKMSQLLPDGQDCGKKANSQNPDIVIQQNGEIYKSARKHGASHEEATKIVKLIRGGETVKARQFIKKIIAREKTEHSKAKKQKASVERETKVQASPDQEFWDEITSKEFHDKLKENDPAAWEKVREALNGSDPEKTIKVLQALSTTTAKIKSDTPEKGSPADDVLVTVEKDTEAAFEKLAKEMEKKKEDKTQPVPSSKSAAPDTGAATSDDEFKKSDLDDSVQAFINGQGVALPGQTIPLRVNLVSAVHIDADSLFYQWTGEVTARGRTALFTRNTPGTYPLQVRVYNDKSCKQLLAVTPLFSIRLFSPDQAIVGLNIQGPPRANLNEDVSLKARIFGKNKAGKQLLATADTFVQWLADGTVLNSGPELAPSFPEPGSYSITARLIQDTDGDLHILAETDHRITVSGPAVTQGSGQDSQNNGNNPILPRPDPDNQDSTAADNDTFGKMADAAAEKFKNSTTTKQHYTNPPGCPPVTVREEKAETAAGVDNSFVPFDESETSKPTIEIDSGDASPCQPGDADCEEAERLGIVREPLIPAGPGSPEPPAAKPKKKNIPETRQQSQDFHIQLVPRPRKAVFQPGDDVQVLACIDRVDAESLPLSFSWKGVDSSSEAVAALSLEEPGSRQVSVAVQGKNGLSGRAAIGLDVGKITVALDRYPRLPIPMGKEVSLSARVLVNGKPARGTSYIYRWQPHEDLKFTPLEGTTGKTTARFPAPGTYKIWVDVYQPAKAGSFARRLAQSKQVEITVQAIKAALSARPSSPMVGDKVTVTASLVSDISPKLLRFVWDAKGWIRQGTPSANGRSYTFVPMDDKPVTITLKVLVREGGLQELDDQAISVTAQQYKVAVSAPKRLDPPPWKWDPIKGTTVELPQAIATFQNAEVHCSLAPQPKNRLSYRWSASPDGCSIAAPFSQSTNLNAHEPGSYQVAVTVTDAQGIVLGRGGTTFSVTVSKQEMEAARQKAEHLKKARHILQQAQKLWQQGKLKQAITTVAQAQHLAPNDKKMAKIARGMQKQKTTIDKKLARCTAVIKTGDLDQAAGILAGAAAISDQYKKYLSVSRQLAEAREKEKQQKKKLIQVNKLMQQARTAWKQHQWDQAVALAEKVVALDPNNKEAGELFHKLKKKRNALLRKREELISEAGKAEDAGSLQQAISLLEMAQKIRSEQNITNRINEIQEMLRLEQEQKKQFASLLRQAEDSAQNDDLVRALELIDQCLLVFPDHPKASALRKKWREQLVIQKNNEKFSRLVSKGEQAEQAGDYDGALKKYRQALAVHTDDAIANRIKTLQSRLNKQQAEKKRKERRDNKFKTLVRQGREYEKYGNLTSAIRVFRQALAIKDDKKLRRHVVNLEKEFQQRQDKRKQMEKERQKREQFKRERHERTQKKILQKHLKQRNVGKKTHKAAAAPWTGTFRGVMGEDDIKITITLHLSQRGNRIQGNGTMRMQGYNADDTAALSIQGSCQGRRAQLQLSGPDGGASWTAHLAGNGSRIHATVEGEQITLQRIR